MSGLFSRIRRIGKPEDPEVASDPLDPENQEIAAGFSRDDLEGTTPKIASNREKIDALERAFSYRGDVTITRADGSSVEGYIFNRSRGASLSQSYVQLYPKDSTSPINVPYSEIAGLSFSGSDRAAGRSWEAWVAKYKAKKDAGEKDVSLHPEDME